MPKLGSALLKIGLGLTLGLSLAEGAFHLRDEGAFPHLNLYQADSALGVKLRPNEQMRLRVADNPVTTIHTNSRGFRGEEWPRDSANEILVVGDSQVFGLGVEDGETFAVQLESLRKQAVLNGGVPTYGPREYTEIVARAAKERKLAAVVYVVNLANDLFEADRPNSARHAVWDGWAVRRETAPERVTAFPGRAWLMGRSHLMFAARQLLYARGDNQPVALATEGTWQDLAGAARSTPAPKAPDELARESLNKQHELAVGLEYISQTMSEHMRVKIGNEARFAGAIKPLIKGGDPRDILDEQETYAESSRPIRSTAYHLFMAAIGEASNETFLQQLAEKTRDKQLTELLQKRTALRAQVDALHANAAPRRTPLESTLLRTKEICDAEGAKLLVVALPLDVMVSADEWKKYGVEPVEMAPTHVLTKSLLVSAQRMGIAALDATPVLARAEPGAFLQKDLHMTPKGHRALAGAIAVEIDRAPGEAASYTLPQGRSFPPTIDEWRRVDEVLVRGSSAASCETKMVREWVRLLCHKQEKQGSRDFLRAVRVDLGGHGDVRVFNSYDDEYDLAMVAPVLPNDTLRARFEWNTHARDLTLSRDLQGVPRFAFGEPRKLRQGETQQDDVVRERDGADLAAIAQPRECSDNERVGGAFRTCAPACDEKTPCAKGHCEPWPTGGFCAVP